MRTHLPRSTTGLLALCLCAALPASAGSKLDDALKQAERQLKGEDAAPAAPAVDERAATAKGAPLAALVSADDATAGMKEALAQGVQKAIAQLGREDGFLGDAAVRIAAPKKLRKVVDAARKLGAGAAVDEFERSMNRAAEKAVPLAADIVADAVRAMTVDDAIAIVRGEPDAATRYFRKATGERLQAAFLPVVSDATAQSGVAKRYQALMDKSGGLGGLLGQDDVDLNRYVTGKAMDGLFHYVAEQEKAIRANPMQQGSDLLRRVFGQR